MAIYSPLRSRRQLGKQAEATQRLITFRLGEELFALPLSDVTKVTTLDRLYGDPNGSGVSLTTYQGRELVVIDVAHQIFGQIRQQLLPTKEKSASIGSGGRSTDDAVRFLLILQPQPGRLVGLPIDSAPNIQSLPVSAFKPLPEIYRQHSNIHCVKAHSIDLPDRPSLFLLDLALLVPKSADR